MRSRRRAAATLCGVWLALAALRSPTSRDLIETADLSSLALSPDGRSILVRVERPDIDANAVRLGWWLVDVERGDNRRLADAGSPTFSDAGVLEAAHPLWAPAGDAVYWTALRGRGVQVEAFDLGSGRLAALSDDPGDVGTFALSGDGRSLVYEAGAARAAIAAAELNEYRQGVFVDGTVDMAQPLFRGGQVNGRKATQRFSDEWFGRSGLLADAPRRRVRIDLDDRSAHPLEDAMPSSDEATALSASGDRAAIVLDGVRGAVEVTRAAGERMRCEAPGCAAGRALWASWLPGSDRLVVAVRDDDGVERLLAWRPGARTTREIVAVAGTINGGAEDRPCALTADYALCVVATPAGPPALERIALSTGARERLLDPNASLRRSVGIDVRPISWRDGAGRRFTGLYYPAAGGGPAPLFVNYYLCRGFVRGGIGEEWPFAVLASHGVAALCINKFPAALSPLESYDRALSGISAIVGQLQAEGKVDQRIGIGGLSFGSEVALWVARHSDLAAAVSMASLHFEPIYYWLNAVAGRTQPETLRRSYGLGAPDETPALWRTYSAALDVEHLRAPMLMQLPEQEARYVMELYAKLSRSCTPAEMYVFPDEPHLKTQPAHRAAVQARNIDWFRFWLKGEDPDGAGKADQYRRWRALRARAASRDCSQSSTPAKESSR